MLALALAVVLAGAAVAALAALRWWAASALEDPTLDLFDLPLTAVPQQRSTSFVDHLPRYGAHERFLVEQAGAGLRELEDYLASGGAH